MTEDKQETLSNLCTRSDASSRRRSSRRTPTSRPRRTTRRPSDRLAFWAEAGRAARLGHRSRTEVLDWSNPPFAKWFVGGKLNAAYNCVDRHVEAGNGDRVAIHWVGEPEDDTRTSPTPS